MLKNWVNPTGFLDSSSADGGGANWTVLGQKKNCPILNTCVDAHCPYVHEHMLPCP